MREETLSPWGITTGRHTCSEVDHMQAHPPIVFVVALLIALVALLAALIPLLARISELTVTPT